MGSDGVSDPALVGRVSRRVLPPADEQRRALDPGQEAPAGGGGLRPRESRQREMAAGQSGQGRTRGVTPEGTRGERTRPRSDKRAESREPRAENQQLQAGENVKEGGTMRERTSWVMMAALVGLLLTGPAIAVDFPTRPVNLVVGFAAGGETDIVVRAMNDKLGEDLGQPAVVLNKAGSRRTDRGRIRGQVQAGRLQLAHLEPVPHPAAIGGFPDARERAEGL